MTGNSYDHDKAAPAPDLGEPSAPGDSSMEVKEKDRLHITSSIPSDTFPDQTHVAPTFRLYACSTLKADASSLPGPATPQTKRPRRNLFDTSET